MRRGSWSWRLPGRCGGTRVARLGRTMPAHRRGRQSGPPGPAPVAGPGGPWRSWRDAPPHPRGRAGRLLGALSGSVAPGPDRTAPPEFVAPRDIALGNQRERRYAPGDNFAGGPVDGYREPGCLLTRAAALAPGRRAVDDVPLWGADPGATRTPAECCPRVPRGPAVRGRPPRGPLRTRPGRHRGRHAGPAAARAGGHGDAVRLSVPASAPDSRKVGVPRREARSLPGSAPTARGFAPVPTEWWHFTPEPEPFPDSYVDFPVSRDAPRAPDRAPTVSDGRR